jgi:hypothetical protein
MLPPRAYIFIGLNGVRVLSIIALLLMFSSSIFVMVTDIKAVNTFQSDKQSADLATAALLDCDYILGSTVPNQPAGVFWAIVNRLLILFQVIILLFSELGWPAAFFDRFFPVLGPAFGLGALGIFQCLIAASVLSHHVDDFTLVAAFFLFSLGCLNMVLGLIFREAAKAKRSLTSWRAEAKALLPHDVRPAFTSAAPSFVSSVFSGSPKDEEAADFGSWKSTSGNGFGRQGEKAAGLKGFLISKPLESLPRYATRPASTVSPAASHATTPAFNSSATAL